MSVHLVGLALLMAAVTYPFRALPLFAPTKDRLPPVVQRYLRLVGPAILAALAAGNTAFGRAVIGA
jgi:branched-subunit amino acid transport protein